MTEAPQQEHRPAADIATAIGGALAQATQTTGTGRTEDTAEVRAITEAMVRLLAGVPLHSDGQLTIKSLAEEAGLRRNKLTHKHTGLKDLFYALVRSQDYRPKIAGGLQAGNDQLRQKLAGLAPRTPNSSSRWPASSGSSTSWKWKTPSYASKASPAMSSVR